MIAAQEVALTIQQTAQTTGLSVDTLRYYERIGLVDRVARASNGHRRYTREDIDRLTFLNNLRLTGLSLAQMRRYAALHRQADGGIAGRVAILTEYRAVLAARIDALTRTLGIIDYKIDVLSQQIHK